MVMLMATETFQLQWAMDSSSLLVWAQRLLDVRFYSQSGRMLPATAVFLSTWDTSLGGVCTSSIYDLLSLRFSLFLSLSLSSSFPLRFAQNRKASDPFIRSFVLPRRRQEAGERLLCSPLEVPTADSSCPHRGHCCAGAAPGVPRQLASGSVRSIPIVAFPPHPPRPFLPGQERYGGRSMEESETTRIEEEVRKAVEQAKELQDSAASFIGKASGDEKSLRQRAAALDSTIRRLRSSIGSLLAHKLLDPNLADKLNEELRRAKCVITDGDASAFLPSKPQVRFLRMFLGPVDVRALKKDIQLKVKEEYNSYRDRTALLFLLFPAALLILRSWLWDGCLPAFPVQLYEAWLLFLYTGLALRENILRVNGSDIRPWWIYHHYCAMIMALVSLTWEIKGQPNCAQKQRGVQLFLQWAMMQGIAMLLQNRYQRQRLYTRIALGKAKRMDVVWGETAGVDGQLWLLCPLLFIMQGFEAYVGLLLLRTAFVGVVSEWQVISCGVLLVLMAVGNFVNTVQTLMAKSRFKAKMKRSKSKQEFN